MYFLYLPEESNTCSAACSSTAKNRILDKIHMPTPTSGKVLYHITCRAGKKFVTRHLQPLSALISTLSSRSNPQHTEDCQEFQVMLFISPASYRKYTAVFHI